jgi:hypothetical protein
MPSTKGALNERPWLSSLVLLAASQFSRTGHWKWLFSFHSLCDSWGHCVPIPVMVISRRASCGLLLTTVFSFDDFILSRETGLTLPIRALSVPANQSSILYSEHDLLQFIRDTAPIQRLCTFIWDLLRAIHQLFRFLDELQLPFIIAL